MKPELVIGKVLRPRGLKGEVKAELYASDPSRFGDFPKSVAIDGRTYAVEKHTLDGAFVYLQLGGVQTVEQAELLRGKDLLVRRDDLPKLNDGEHYIADLLGLDVYVSGERIGELVDVSQYGSADVYTVRLANGSVSFPAIKQLIKCVDVEGGKLLLDGAVFDRVAVYN